MSEKITKFDALAHAISVLGQPHEVSKNRLLKASHGVVSDAHMWALPCGCRLAVDKWSDGDESFAGSICWRETEFVGVRANDDGSLCHGYEEQARGMIEAYATVAAVTGAQSEGTR